MNTFIIIICSIIMIIFIDTYRFYLHEYGHVLEIVKNLYNNANEYKRYKKENKITVTGCKSYINKLHIFKLAKKKKLIVNTYNT